jgi:hypothetical protein
MSAERRGRLDANTQERKTTSKKPKTTNRTIFSPILIDTFLCHDAEIAHSSIIKARKSTARWGGGYTQPGEVDADGGLQ